MVLNDQRRLKVARIGVDLLDVVPKPDQPPASTVDLAGQLGVASYEFEYPAVWRSLDRLERLGLVERVADCPPTARTVFWRLTPAGQTWKGTAEDLTRPLPHLGRLS